MLSLTSKAWSPYVAGVIIGLLQIPTFLLMDTALGASSSYVTVAAHIASFFDGRLGEVKYLASHLWGAKNWWQVAVVVGIAVGAFISMKLSGARRQAISPVWARATGTPTLMTRAPLAFVAGEARAQSPGDGRCRGDDGLGLFQIAGAAGYAGQRTYGFELGACHCCNDLDGGQGMACGAPPGAAPGH